MSCQFCGKQYVRVDVHDRCIYCGGDVRIKRELDQGPCPICGHDIPTPWSCGVDDGTPIALKTVDL